MVGLYLRIRVTANYDDPLAKTRDAPPEPLPIQFPEYIPALKPSALTARKHADLKKLLMGIKNPTDVAVTHVEAFNVKYRAKVAVSNIVPELPDGLIEEPTFNALVKEEFAVENDPCFRKVCRLPPEKGQTLPRLAQSYVFFKNLEDMSRYWDNSKDKYFEGSGHAESTIHHGDKRKNSVQKENIKPPSDTNGDVHMTDSTNDKVVSQDPSSLQVKKLYTGRRFGNSSTMPPHLRDGVLEGLVRTATQKFNSVCKSPTPQYARLQVGDLLIPVRQTLVVGRVPTDRAEARKMITVGPMLVGSARSEVVFHKDGEQPGEGQGDVADFLRELGGLLLLAQQRHREGKTEATPGSDESCWWAKQERWGGGKGGKMPHEELETSEEFPKIEEDVAMEDLPIKPTRAKRSHDSSATGEAALSLKPMLNAALDKTAGTRDSARAAAAAAVLKMTSSTGELAVPLSPDTTSTPRSERPPMSSRRIAAMCSAWKLLKPPSSLWDPNLTYKAIGKIDGIDGEWDDVFMVSCINTHVSLLKMRVSNGYMSWLETGKVSEVQQEKKWGRSGITLPTVQQEGKDWNGDEMSREVLYLERSVWWDMFEPKERVEALRALWMVLSWLSREVGGGKLPWSVE
jgi:hypothetical protein